MHKHWRRLNRHQQTQLAVEGVAVATLALSAPVVAIFASSPIEGLLMFGLSVLLASPAQSRMESLLPHNESVVQLRSSDRDPEFDSMVEAPTGWMFRGGTGRWFRSVAVPSVARLTHGSPAVTALLLDPRNREACEAYARFRKQSRWYSDDTLFGRGVQPEILATIYSLIRVHGSTRTNVSVAFTGTYGLSRFDANEKQMIVTTPSRDNPPLLVMRSHWLYHAVRDEVDQATSFGPVVVIPETEAPNRNDSESIRRFLATIMVRTGNLSSPLLADYAADGSVDWDQVSLGLSSTGDEENASR